MRSWQEVEKNSAAWSIGKVQEIQENRQKQTTTMSEIVNESRNSKPSEAALLQANIEMQSIQTQQLMDMNQQLANQSQMMAADSALNKQLQNTPGASDKFYKKSKYDSFYE
jgi:conjugal transfer/entry exclusion protein